MPANLKNFIRSMRTKYKGMLTPSKEPSDIFSGKEAGPSASTSRFTGFGADGRLQDSRPAGIVHEGEAVIPAAEVRNMGGPEALRAKIDQGQAGIPSQEVTRINPEPQGANASQPEIPKEAQFRGGSASARRLPGYANGTTQVQPEGGAQLPSGNVASVPSTPTPVEGENITRSVNTFSSPTNPEAGSKTPSGNTVTLDKTPAVESEVAPVARTSGLVAPQETETVTAPKPAVSSEFVDQRTDEQKEADKVAENAFRAKSDIEDMDKLEIDKPSDEEIAQQTERATDMEALEDKQITELQAIQAGESKAQQLINDISRRQLAGRLSASEKSSMQAAMQNGMSGGELNAFMARSKRDSRLAQTGLEGQLAVDALNRAENATAQLLSAAQTGQKLEEMKREFNEGMELDWEKLGLTADQANIATEQWKSMMSLEVDKFVENIRQFGEQTALAMFDINSNIGKWKAEFFTSMGDFDTADEVFQSAFGVDPDFSKMASAESRKNFGNAMANVSASVGAESSDYQYFTENEDGTFNLSADGMNHEAVEEAVRAWNEKEGTSLTAEKLKDDPAAFDWVKNTIDTQIAMKSEGWTMAQSFTPNELFSMVQDSEVFNDAGEPLYLTNPDVPYDADDPSTYTIEDTGTPAKMWDDISSFKFGNANGVEGVRLALAHLKNTGGLTYDENGFVVADPEKETWELFNLCMTSYQKSKNKASDATIEDIDNSGNTTLQANKAAYLPEGAKLHQNDDGTYYDSKGNEYNENMLPQDPSKLSLDFDAGNRDDIYNLITENNETEIYNMSRDELSTELQERVKATDNIDPNKMDHPSRKVITSITNDITNGLLSEIYGVTSVDTTAAVLHNAGLSSGFNGGDTNLTRGARALNVLSGIIENTNLTPDEAYKMAYNLVGDDLPDALDKMVPRLPEPPEEDWRVQFGVA